MKHNALATIVLALIAGTALVHAAVPKAESHAPGRGREARISPRPGFAPNDVARRVGGTPGAALRWAGTDDGEFLVDTGIAVVPPPYDQYQPAIAWDGANYLVVWAHSRDRAYDSDIYGARVTAEGRVLDPTGIAISRATSWSESDPALVFDGTDFLVVWRDTRNGNSDIYGARVTPQGVLLDTSGIAVSTAADDQVGPAVSCDGTNCLVVWADFADGFIRGARVTPQGTVCDSPGIAISAIPGESHTVP